MKKGRTFVMGDLHGAYKAMMQCLERSGFDYEKDKLIFLGDIYDGWSQGKECVEEFFKIKKLVHLLGNHDDWTLQWALKGEKPDIWLWQGGDKTIEGYNNYMPKDHRDFLSASSLYHIDKNRLFVHAGFNSEIEIEKQDKETLIWDRKLVETAVIFSGQNREEKFTKYDEVYAGHTPTIRYKVQNPMKCGNVWLMDTGAGWNGCLSIMNIDTKEYFCSDNVKELYPDEKGRF